MLENAAERPARRRRLGLLLLTALLLTAHLWLARQVWSPGAVTDAGPGTGTGNSTRTPVRIVTLQAAADPAPTPPTPPTSPTPPAEPTPAEPARPPAPVAPAGRDGTPDAAPAAAVTAQARPPAREVRPAGPGALLVPAPTPGGTSPGQLDSALQAGAAAVPGTATAVALSARPPSSDRGAAAPTELPPSAQLVYAMSRGSISGRGELTWRLDAGHYELRLEGKVPVLGSILLQTSQGEIDRHGLAPRRHTERRIGRSERAVNFSRPPDGPGRISFSASEAIEPLAAGTQDRVSWMPQLAARLTAWNEARDGHGAPPAGSVLGMDVASTSGTVRRWRFKVMDVTDEGWVHLVREPEHEHDTRSEVWLDPARHGWPVKVVLSDPGGEALVLLLRELRPL